MDKKGKVLLSINIIMWVIEFILPLWTLKVCIEDFINGTYVGWGDNAYFAYGFEAFFDTLCWTMFVTSILWLFWFAFLFVAIGFTVYVYTYRHKLISK